MAAYAEIIHWKHNLFHAPSGKARISFVNTLASLFRAYGECSSMESIALRAAMVLPILLLQKPHARSKTKDHVACLQRRLTLWKAGNIDALLREGHTIQSQFKITSPLIGMHDQQQDQTTRLFTKYMKHGNVKAAIRLLDNQNNGKVFSLNTPILQNGTPSTVRDALIDKHPTSQPANPETLLDPSNRFGVPHPILFETLDGK